MKTSKKSLVACILIISGLHVNSQSHFQTIEETMDYAKSQINKTLQVTPDDKFPRKNYEGAANWLYGNTLAGFNDWTAGFWPGCLWLMYEWTRDSAEMQNAKKWTAGLEIDKNDTTIHDVGFKIMCSYGNGYRLDPSESYKNIIVTAAQSLSKRYRPAIESIDSWDWGEWNNVNVVIIDNMVNLELLFYVTQLSGDSSFYKIAVKHAKKTLVTHQRANGTFYHIVEYDNNNNVIYKGMIKGWNVDKEETWARGQGWALYGFTMCYRYTHDSTFLVAAEKLATYLTENLPTDYIPKYIFENTVDKNRDASAGAIMLSGIMELYGITKKSKYLTLAESMIKSLSAAPYITKEKSYFSILALAAENYKDQQKGLIYADYYFIEALLRYKKLIIAGIKDQTISTKSVSFELSQNYPNPFNPTTKITYYIASPENVQIIVYDLLGKVVSVLVDRYRQAGNYDVDFNAQQLSSGIYFYRIITEKYSSEKKMLLLR